MQSYKSYIYLDNMRFYAYHGVGEQESLIGNEFIVSLQLQVDITTASETDCVEDTVSYADVHQAVKEEMATPSRLLEHVAARIVRRLLKEFQAIEQVKIKLAKRNPPMGADIEAAGVEICCSRN